MPSRLDDDATIGPVAAARTPAPGGFTPGAIIAGRYRLVAPLGRGGMEKCIAPTISRSINRSR